MATGGSGGEGGESPFKKTAQHLKRKKEEITEEVITAQRQLYQKAKERVYELNKEIKRLGKGEEKRSKLITSGIVYIS